MTTEHDRRYPGWPVVLACAAGSFFTSIPYYTFAVFLRPVAQEFSWSREAAAAGYATMALLAAVAAPFAGRVIDRVGARRIILPSMTIVGLSVMSLCLLTSSLLHFYAVCAVIGVASIGASMVAYSRVVFGWFETLRGRALGLVLAGGMVSTIVLPPLAINLMRLFGWRTAWLVLGATTVVLGVPIVMRWLEERPVSATTPIADAGGVPWQDAVRTRLFWTLIAVISGAAMLVSGSIVHVSALLTDRGFTPERAALALSTMGAANLTGRLLAGWLLDRYHPARVAAGMLALGALGGLVLANAATLPAALAAAILIGLGSGGEMDVNPYLLARYFGLRSLATLYGFNWLALGTASALGPILMGRAFDATGTYTLVLVQLAAVTVGGAALMLTLPARREATPAPPMARTA